jgi:hypothetical protein
MNLTCPLCGGRMAVGREVCTPCDDQLVRDLADIPDLAYQLDLTETRQTRHGERGTGRPAETGLSWDERARVAHDHLRQVLAGWVGELRRGGGLPASHSDTASLARWLTTHRIHLLRHPAFDEAIGQIRQAVKQARWAIDLPAETWYAGPCNTPLIDAEGAETGEVCAADLYARHGAPKIVCRSCRASHELAYRFDWVMGEACNHLASPAEIARAMSGFGAKISAVTIRVWAHRGRITSKGTDRNGQPTYRIGDVLELLPKPGEEKMRGSA